MKTAFIYSDEFGSYSYGGSHPMRPARLKLTYELIKAYRLLDLPDTQIIEARKASEEEVLLFHTKDYINVLKEANDGVIPENGWQHGLGYGDNPVFTGVYDWSLYSAGASVQAAETVLSGHTDFAFNICGGLHHAMKDKASGFCYLNDAVIAIEYLLERGKRVAYVDIDAHHGDSVQFAFYDTDRVMTISLHENGEYLFPGTGFSHEIGTGKGKGYSVNLPFPPETDDMVFVNGFEEIVPVFIEKFRPDILITQLGVDTFRTDPITHLNLTTNGFKAMVKRFRSFNLPWVALGGGGYNLSNVARAWTIAWGIMNDAVLTNKMPDSFSETAREFNISERILNDAEDEHAKNKFSDKKELIWKEVSGNIDFLKRTALPLIG